MGRLSTWDTKCGWLRGIDRLLPLRHTHTQIIPQSTRPSIPAMTDTAMVAVRNSWEVLLIEPDDSVGVCPIVLVVLVVLVVAAVVEAGEVNGVSGIIPGGVNVAEYRLMKETPPQASLPFP